MKNEDDSRETHRQIELINAAVVGTVVAVAYAYIVIEQCDPDSTCPSLTSRCWILVAALGISGILFVFILPLLTLFVLRSLKKTLREEEEASDEKEVASWSRKLKNMPKAVVRRAIGDKVRQVKFIQEFSSRLQRLVISATHAMVAVSNYNLIYYLMRQLYLLFEKDEEKNQGSFSSTAEVSDSWIFLVLTFFMCLFFGIAYISCIVWATKNLCSGDAQCAYWTEVELLAQSGSVFPLAYASLECISIVFFAPLAFGAASDNVRAFELALFEFVIVFFGCRELSRYIFRLLDRSKLDSNFPDALADAFSDGTSSKKESYRDCILVVIYFVLGVVPVIALMQALSTLILDVFNLTSTLQNLLFFLVLAPILLLITLSRTHHKYREEIPAETVAPALTTEDCPPNDETPFLHTESSIRKNEEQSYPCCTYLYEVFLTRKPTDAVFEDTLEKWLLVLTFWQIFKYLLILVWDNVDFIITSDNATSKTIFLILARFLWQLFVALVVTLFFAIVPTIFVLFQENQWPETPHAYLKIAIAILTCDSSLIRRLRNNNTDGHEHKKVVDEKIISA